MTEFSRRGLVVASLAVPALPILDQALSESTFEHWKAQYDRLWAINDARLDADLEDDPVLIATADRIWKLMVTTPCRSRADARVKLAFVMDRAAERDGDLGAWPGENPHLTMVADVLRWLEDR